MGDITKSLATNRNLLFRATRSYRTWLLLALGPITWKRLCALQYAQKFNLLCTLDYSSEGFASTISQRVRYSRGSFARNVNQAATLPLGTSRIRNAAVSKALIHWVSQRLHHRPQLCSLADFFVVFDLTSLLTTSCSDDVLIYLLWILPV